jgi:hypothetical protein
MATIAFTFPVLAGQTERWREFARQVTGPRRAEWDEMHERVGMTENWYLQHLPNRDLGIVYMEGPDLEASFRELAASSHPFDAWYKEEIRGVHGIDFNQVPPWPLAEVLAESVRSAALPGRERLA